jgi:hypothetical protein
VAAYPFQIDVVVEFQPTAVLPRDRLPHASVRRGDLAAGRGQL